MQTFIPYGSDFDASARILDRQRLGKQRVECLQILNTLTGVSTGWANHPAVRMWKGYEVALACYGITICSEWIDRGYNDTCFNKIIDMFDPQDLVISKVVLPPWIDDIEVTISHKSNLIRKKPSLYAMIWPEVPDDIPYKWPV